RCAASPTRCWPCSASPRAPAGGPRSWSDRAIGRARGSAAEPRMTGFASLTDFLAELESRGDLKRVSREVDWAYEVTEIACREAASQGPALLFERVRGASFPLAVNVLSATRRIEWALGRTPASVGDELESLMH